MAGGAGARAAGKRGRAPPASTTRRPAGAPTAGMGASQPDVSTAGSDEVPLVAGIMPGNRVLIIGCNAVWRELAREVTAKGATVVAIDKSSGSVARASSTGINARRVDAEELHDLDHFHGMFHAVLTVGTLDGMLRAKIVLEGVHKALVNADGACFRGELRGHGSHASLRIAAAAALGRAGVQPPPEPEEGTAAFLPTANDMVAMLHNAYFRVRECALTPHVAEGDEDDAREVLLPLIKHVPDAAVRAEVAADALALAAPVLRDSHGHWWTVSTRIYFDANKRRMD